MISCSDHELILAARTGDKQAFGEVAEQYFVFAQGVALQRVGSLEIAEELAQEAILQAYLSLNQLREPDRFASWLYGIVVNMCRRHQRDERVDLLPLDFLITSA